ncbi:MAG: DNA double-strand break repair nuclease NurA [Leptolyngbyaceae cyanobacterium bins.302]|nr:DNA double-strand break repair nuclease NurA [Leptolyngbyaceae cyanobacterium bins.302]
MLDLSKIADQMQGMSQHLTQEAAATRQRLERAQTLMSQALQHQSELLDLKEEWRDRLNFTAAEPIEPLNLQGSIATPPAAHTVIATDGSQIAPSHHEIAYCYLINVGRIVLHYGQNRFPLLDSMPEVVYRPEDLYISRQWGISTEEWMGYRRTVSEAIVLAELALETRTATRSSFVIGHQSLASEGQMTNDEEHSFNPQPPTPNPQTSPTLALTDGSLIYWFLESLPNEARDRILTPILEAWERLRQAKVPLVGYLSASRSGEALNFLRLQACPYETPDCLSRCAGQRDRFPCQVLEPLKDTKLWAVRLSPGQRSPLWRSSASILDLYGKHRVYFCYVNVGTEIARVEFPEWVVQDAEMLNSSLSLVIAQVQKGYGYPVALAEAHNQAVVRGGDRTRFFALLEQEMIRAGLQNVGVSYKEARKRGSIA